MHILQTVQSRTFLRAHSNGALVPQASSERQQLSRGAVSSSSTLSACLDLDEELRLHRRLFALLDAARGQITELCSTSAHYPPSGIASLPRPICLSDGASGDIRRTEGREGSKRREQRGKRGPPPIAHETGQMKP